MSIPSVEVLHDLRDHFVFAAEFALKCGYLIFHGYDARDRGRSKLRIEELQWDDEGWPSLAPRPAA